MLINDRVYGQVEITEPVILELINSKPMQRLKGICQAGSAKYIIQKTITRFEHCIGVMLLLKKLNASKQEQIAGLIHDIAHTAFSHVVDFALDKTTCQNYHEQFHEKIIKSSEIPEILKKHNLDPNIIADETNFPLLENNLPDICADRIDYFFRDTVEKLNNLSELKPLLNQLSVHNNKIICTNQELSFELAKKYMETDKLIWASPVEIAVFQITADAIKIALNKNIITEKDFYLTDDELYNKLKNSNNSEIDKLLALLTPKFQVKLDKDNYDFFMKTKVRCIDPFVLKNNKLVKTSSLFPELNNIIKKHQDFVNKGYHIQIQR